jgi:hypothetical protein
MRVAGHMLVGWAAASKPACSEFDSRMAHRGGRYVVGFFRQSQRSPDCISLNRHLSILRGDTIMNTLPRTITAQILSDPNLYQSIRQQWSKLVRSPRKRELTAAHYLLYAALLGKDWRKGFTCITNQRKLDNGAFAAWALFRATEALHLPSSEEALLAPFGDLVTSSMLQTLRELVPVQRYFNYRYYPAFLSPLSTVERGCSPFFRARSAIATLLTSRCTDCRYFRLHPSLICAN